MDSSERREFIKKKLTELGLKEDEAEVMAEALIKYRYMKVVKALRMMLTEHYRTGRTYTAKDVEKIIRKIRF